MNDPASAPERTTHAAGVGAEAVCPPSDRPEDAHFMQQALQLARQGDTSPNPRVGCVVVREGRVLSTGFHARAGQPHAEVEALRPLDFRAEGATLYVNLEPCSHFGRTPPCVDAILRSGVSRVVAAMMDPNPLVQGQGFSILRQAGIDVVEGVLEADARALNRGFVKAITTGLPWVTLKLAATLDGRTATRTGVSQWITSPQARGRVQQLRHEHDAVLVGVGTVLADDPLLTCRSQPQPDWLGGSARRRPVRVILDSSLRTPLDRKVLGQDAPTWILCGPQASAEKQATLEALGVRVFHVPTSGGRIGLEDALKLLARQGLTYVLAEPGATLAGALVEQGLVDQLTLFLAPKLFGGIDARPLLGGLGVALPSEAHRLSIEAVSSVGPDLLVEARILPPGQHEDAEATCSPG